MKKVLAVFVTAFMFVTVFSACKDEKTKAASATTKSGTTTTLSVSTTATIEDGRATPKVNFNDLTTVKANTGGKTGSSKSSGTTKASSTTASRATTTYTKPSNQIIRGEFGTWTNNVFTNRWSNIRFALLEGYSAMPNRELKDYFGDEDTATNGDNLNLVENARKPVRIDCVLNRFDDLASVFFICGMDCGNIPAEEMQEALMYEFLGADDTSYDLTGYTKEKVGGNTYNVAHYVSAYEADEEDGTDADYTLYTDIYITTIGSDMEIIITVYWDMCASEMGSFISSVIPVS